MTPNDLLVAITDLDDDSILDAKASPKKVLHRRSILALAAAVMVMTMALTVCASPDGAEWFRSFFHDAGKQPLTQGQLQYIEENTVLQKQSQTQGGYTITVDSAISDGVNAFIKLTLTAPEGVVLDADTYSSSHFQLPRDEKGNTCLGGGGFDPFVKDEDKTDNIAPMLIQLGPAVGTTEKPNFTAHTWTIQLEDLQASYRRNWNTPDFEIQRETIALGVWEFQIEFAEDATAIELITEPVPCPAEVLQWPEWGKEEILITSLTLRALSAEMCFTFPEKVEQVNAWIDDIYVVMKDGRQILMRESSGWPNNITFTFAAPIALEEVSHILLPNGTTIPRP